tara:strand:- start:2633 stop:3574 length:942 start_codon:yes stop_codon:yes gene_type:complete
VGPGAVGSMLAANLWLGLNMQPFPFKIRLGGVQNLSRFSKGHLNKIKSDGLLLKMDLNRNFQTNPIVDLIPSSEKADLVIFSVKIFDLLSASQNFLSSISSSSVILVVSNGLNAFDKIDKKIDTKNIFRGLIETGCELNKAGEILQHGEAKIELSRNSSDLNCENNLNLEKIKSLFQSSGFVVSTSNDSRLAEWNKFVANCSINPLATLFECKNGNIVLEPVLDVFCKLCSEIQQLVDSENLPIKVKSKVIKVVKNTSANENSMLKSFFKGSKSELQEMTGEVLRLAEKRKLYLPLNNFLFSALRIIEDKNKM